MASRLAERELDALLVTSLVDVRWLTGFTGTNGACIVAPDRRIFMTDFRYIEQAEGQVPDFDRHRAGRDLLGDMAAHLPPGRVGFDDAGMSVRDHARLAKAVAAGVELRPAGGLIEELREIKDEGEIHRIAAAAELATEALESVLEGGLAGRTEREVAFALEQAMRVAGAQEASFPPIVASGGHGALPHAEPREIAIGEGQLVVIDWGARLDGYCSDCTRTLAAGEPGERAREIYQIVLEAQLAALERIRPGAGRAEVDLAAREIIEARGFGDRFGHGLGHGVGLEVHEGPRLGKTATGVLEAGMVVTDEPGVYLPGELGVRIEDLVVVEQAGPRILTRFPKELTIV